MASDIKITKLDELLSPHLGPKEKISEYRTKSHTAPGENFGSIMISLDIDIICKDIGKKRTLHLVNKMIPQDPKIKDIFNTKITYFKEMDFYLKAVPAMLKLQRDHCVPETDMVTNIFPKCFGARHGFGTQVDNDAAILLENLNLRGYSLRNKKTGVDLSHALLVMEKLAYLHALPIALKKNRPEDYASSIEPAAKYFIINEDCENREEAEKKWTDVIEQIFRNKLPLDPNVIEVGVDTTKGMGYGRVPEAKEPFVTMSHEDLWVNNVLFQADPENKELPAQPPAPTALAFVDFQTTRLSSPVWDILFFLFTSVTPSVRRQHFDKLFQVYYESFCKCLRQVKCDVSEFSKEAFLAEMDRIGGCTLSEIFSRLRVIEARKEEMVGEDWFYNVNLGGEDYVKRVTDVVLDFSRRGWLKNLKVHFENKNIARL